MTGKPIDVERETPSSIVRTNPPRGVFSPALSIVALNNSRSSALRIASSFAPISSTPYFSSTPFSARATAVLSAVCPPIVGSMASGRSRSMIFSTK